MINKTVQVRCALCHGTGTKYDGSQCMCYLFGGPIKRFDGDLWEVMPDE